MTEDLHSLPADLPVPEDDGAARHLPGARLPDIALPATAGGSVELAALEGRSVVYVYPRTGVPGRPSLTEDWDRIPGARGCTLQSCGFRELYAELRTLGVRVYGLSTQDTEYQREAVERLELPFSLLSDVGLGLTRALRLPTHRVADVTLLKRMGLVIRDGVIEQVFYPVFPPDAHAREVLAWIRQNPA